VRGLLSAVLLVMACGRTGFDPLHDAGAIDGAGGAPHVHTAAGWTARIAVDLTGLVPYRPDDFMDGSNEILDNAPLAVAALYAPFTAALAVSAGRDVIELASDGTAIVHDYRPAVPDTSGPDQCAELVFGAPSDVGPALWIGATSQNSGDGLYSIDPTTWAIARDASNNNVNGLAWDPTGAFDATGVPAIYFIDQNDVYRRDGSDGSASAIYAEPDTMGGIAIGSSELFTTNDLTEVDLDRIYSSTHALQTIAATPGNFAIAEGPATASVAVVRDGATLAIYADDGTEQDLASSTDPDWIWIAASAPTAPHPLAGGYVVLESNRTLDRDDLVYLAPGP
jgi:hypothetical protein